MYNSDKRNTKSHYVLNLQYLSISYFYVTRTFLDWFEILSRYICNGVIF